MPEVFWPVLLSLLLMGVSVLPGRSAGAVSMGTFYLTGQVGFPLGAKVPATPGIDRFYSSERALVARESAGSGLNPRTINHTASTNSWIPIGMLSTVVIVLKPKLSVNPA